MWVKKCQSFQRSFPNTHANHHTLSCIQVTYPDTCSISKSSGCFVTFSSFESVDDEYFFVDKVSYDFGMKVCKLRVPGIVQLKWCHDLVSVQYQPQIFVLVWYPNTPSTCINYRRNLKGLSIFHVDLTWNDPSLSWNLTVGFAVMVVQGFSPPNVHYVTVSEACI